MIADQCSKAWIVTRFDLHDARAVFVNFFHIVHVRNTGVAFGFLSNLDPKWGNPLLIVATLFAIGGVLAYLHFHPPPGPSARGPGGGGPLFFPPPEFILHTKEERRAPAVPFAEAVRPASE